MSSKNNTIGLPDCDRILTESSGDGFITTPLYPQDYPRKVECSYEIRAPAGRTIALEWIDFELENSFACLSDKVLLYDGHMDSRALLGRYCGKNLPELMISKTNILIIRFFSDSRTVSRGFKAQYSFSEQEGSKYLFYW